MATPSSCPPGSDNVFGPRVDAACRSFDFTLLFEDACFTLLPAAAILIILPLRFTQLCRASRKLSSHRLTVWKQLLLSLLLILQILYAVFQSRATRLATRASYAASVVNVVAVTATALHSAIEDQRSSSPSDILVLFFSVSSILSVPRLRTLWQIGVAAAGPCPVLWTAISAVSVLIVVAESVGKTNLLRSPYRDDTTKEASAGFWKRSLFVWLLPFLGDGYSTKLQLNRLPAIDRHLRAEATQPKIQKAWKERRFVRRYRLFLATLRAYLPTLLSAVIPRLLLSAFSFCQPFLITATVNYVGLEERDTNRSNSLIGAFVLVYVGMAVARAVYARQVYRMTTMMRSGLISLIHQKTMSLRAVDLKDRAATALVGTDVERVATSLQKLHELWAPVLEMAVAIYLLQRQVGAVCIIPVIVCIASIVATMPLSGSFRNAQIVWIQRLQERLKTTSTMLGSIKSVQMLGLSQAMSSFIANLRRTELKTSEKFRKLLICQIVLSNLPESLAPFATFVGYAIVIYVKQDNAFDVSTVFTALSLISLLTQPILVFCQVLPDILQAMGSFDRIEAYLNRTPSPTESEEDLFITARPESNGIELQQQSDGQLVENIVVTFENCSVSWGSGETRALHGVNLDVRRGITMVVGPVGSGKSTLLEAMLGEATVVEGSISKYVTNAGYCGQIPWIFDQSIRSNIVGDSSFDEEWFSQVIQACGLEGDLKRLPGGILYKTGSNGDGLSGGQKQRIALARAVYARLPIIILDDVLSGVDRKAIKIIARHLFSPSGLFRRLGTTVILATHTAQILPLADSIIRMDAGHVVSVGPFERPYANDTSLTSELSKATDDDSEDSVSTDADEPASAKSAKPESEGRIRLENEHASTSSPTVYRYYFQGAGWWIVGAFVVLNLLEALCNNLGTLWLESWVTNNDQQPNHGLGKYIGVYALITALSLTSVIGACYLLIIMIINKTAYKLHDDILKATLSAPLYFFTQTDTGSLVNHFSQDMNLIDMDLPLQAIQFATGACGCLVKLIILCIVGRYLAASIPILLATLYIIQRFYLRTSRQVRLLDIAAKAPLHAHILDTMAGAPTIRALRWSAAFRSTNHGRLDDSTRPFYALLSVQQWLRLVLDLVVAGMAIVLVCIAVLTAGSSEAVSPGFIGVALVLILTFNQELTGAINAYTKMETSIGAVYRIHKFTNETPSEDQQRGIAVAEVPPPNIWPTEGDLSIKNLKAAYA